MRLGCLKSLVFPEKNIEFIVEKLEYNSTYVESITQYFYFFAQSCGQIDFRQIVQYYQVRFLTNEYTGYFLYQSSKLDYGFGVALPESIFRLFQFFPRNFFLPIFSKFVSKFLEFSKCSPFFPKFSPFWHFFVKKFYDLHPPSIMYDRIGRLKQIIQSI